ncbi:MAG: hypothetical protein FIA89_01440 [Geobacter sp.]|nr:hypothetical protein [Geobacter sp.]
MRTLLLFTCLLFMALPAIAETVFLDIGEESRSIGAAIEFLEDPSGKLTITDVISGDHEERFIRSNRAVPNFGLGDTVYWLRFTVADRNPALGNWLLEQPFPLMNSFDLFIHAPNGTYRMQRYFYSPETPWAPLPHRNPFFSLPVANEPTTFYIRASVGSILTFPLVIKAQDTFFSQNALALLCYGLYFGVMLTMALYNLYLFALFKDRVYLYFVAYIFLFAFLQMSLHGFLRQYLFPSWPDLDNQILRLLILGPSIVSLLFSRRFLNTKQHAPLMDRLLLGLIVIDTVLLFVVPFLDVKPVLTLLNAHTLIAALLATAAGVSCYSSGFRPARYYLAARICFYVSLSIFAVNNMVFHTHTFISWYGMMLGSLLEVVLLSRALADRIGTIMREKEQVEAEMIRAGARVLVGEMAAGVAHEVNNPLTGVMLCFNSIIALPADDPQRDELITVVKGGLRKIRETVAQLLNLSRMSATELGPVQLRTLLDNMLSLCRYQLEKGKVEVIMQIDESIPPMLMDEMKMGHALINLLLNAQHAMPGGGTLTIKAVRSNQWCELSITDTGVGIPPDILPKIFEPFFSTRANGTGTGLGLSICKSVVEAHGGTITAMTEPGKGSCFQMLIPLQAQAGG